MKFARSVESRGCAPAASAMKPTTYSCASCPFPHVRKPPRPKTAINLCHCQSFLYEKDLIYNRRFASQKHAATTPRPASWPLLLNHGRDSLEALLRLNVALRVRAERLIAAYVSPDSDKRTDCPLRRAGRKSCGMALGERTRAVRDRLLSMRAPPTTPSTTKSGGSAAFRRRTGRRVLRLAESSTKKPRASETRTGQAARLGPGGKKGAPTPVSHFSLAQRKRGSLAPRRAPRGPGIRAACSTE
jgi:hypothetical protein